MDKTLLAWSIAIIVIGTFYMGCCVTHKGAGKEDFPITWLFGFIGGLMLGLFFGG